MRQPLAAVSLARTPVPHDIRRAHIEIAKQPGPACVTLLPMVIDDMRAWLAALTSEDLSTTKRIQEQLNQGNDAHPALWSALPADTRPTPTTGGEHRFARRNSYRRDASTREGQAAFLFKDLFYKHRGEVVAVTSEWKSFCGRIRAELVSGQFVVPQPSGAPAFGGGEVHTRGAGGGPDLSHRRSSLVAPDMARRRVFWVRQAQVTTWVRLANALGDRFTADVLYRFYLSCDLLSTKRLSETGANARLRTAAKRLGQGGAEGSAKSRANGSAKSRVHGLRPERF